MAVTDNSVVPEFKPEDYIKFYIDVRSLRRVKDCNRLNRLAQLKEETKP